MAGFRLLSFFYLFYNLINCSPICSILHLPVASSSPSVGPVCPAARRRKLVGPVLCTCCVLSWTGCALKYSPRRTSEREAPSSSRYWRSAPCFVCFKWSAASPWFPPRPGFYWKQMDTVKQKEHRGDVWKLQQVSSPRRTRWLPWIRCQVTSQQLKIVKVIWWILWDAGRSGRNTDQSD